MSQSWPSTFGDRLVGEGEPGVVISEAGVNDDGEIKKSKTLVDVAVEAWIDTVNFQTFGADALVTAGAPKDAYQVEATHPRGIRAQKI